jgi:hypothetical protein
LGDASSDWLASLGDLQGYLVLVLPTSVFACNRVTASLCKCTRHFRIAVESGSSRIYHAIATTDRTAGGTYYLVAIVYFKHKQIRAAIISLNTAHAYTSTLANRNTRTPASGPRTAQPTSSPQATCRPLPQMHPPTSKPNNGAPHTERPPSSLPSQKMRTTSRSVN